MKTRLALQAALLSVLAFACGGSDPDPIAGDGGSADGSPDVVTADAGTDAAPDGAYGGPSTTYPAFKPWMGQLSNLGGPILKNPVIVTITWDGDPNRQTYEDFGDAIGASPYFQAAVGEWGVGPATSGPSNHVHVTGAAPAQADDNGAHQFIQSNLGTLLPAWTDQTIYVLYYPKTTTVMVDGKPACTSGIGGYHDSFDANGKATIYAVLPNCTTPNAVTGASSHEIDEAVTDPLPRAKPAIRSFDDEFLAFELWQRNNDENADSCEFFKDSFYTEVAPLAYTVQRSWSNVQGPLGHSPCQPFATPYWNVAPLALEDLTVAFGNQSIKAKGYKAKQGDTIHIAVGIYSDAATGPITISAAESNPVVNPVTGRLSVSVDPKKTSGVNGESTYIDVTVNNESQQKLELLTVIATLGGVKHYLPLMISNQ